MPDNVPAEQDWYKFLTEGETLPRHFHHLMGLLPSSPRCKLCNSPFKGWGGFLMHLAGRDQSRYNPRYCEKCERFEHPGGAVIELTMLFADVRGSATLAEQLGAHEFSQLMNWFYTTATDILVKTDALVDRLLGDEVIGLYVPGFTGSQHPRRAVKAAQRLLEATGHRTPQGPWLPVGIGSTRDRPSWAWLEACTEVQQISPHSGTMSISLHASLPQRGAGEILISDAAYTASGLDLVSWNRDSLN